MSGHLVEVRGLASGYGVSQVLSGLDLHVDAGELLAVVGSNGAGKTTLMRCLIGQLPMWAGDVLVDDEHVTGSSPDVMLRHGVVLCPEGRHVFPELTVEENLRVGAYLRPRDEVHGSLEQMGDWFPRLAERSDQRAGTLSGGEQQMLAIGRSLMSRPRVLLLDEPSLGLAPVIVDQVFDVIAAIRRQGITTVLVEQNAQLALANADRAYVMESGQFVKTGPGPSLLADEEVRAAYLGI